MTITTRERNTIPGLRTPVEPKPAWLPPGTYAQAYCAALQQYLEGKITETVMWRLARPEG